MILSTSRKGVRPLWHELAVAVVSIAAGLGIGLAIAAVLISYRNEQDRINRRLGG